ncbi:MAG: acyl-CoA dehydrogenase C-terminal domain-containing protein [Rickettsiales bacterium]|nr:acyl-CoA dehydrogenase C-terminal domain-containing protein [Rickettsiales bacterium]
MPIYHAPIRDFQFVINEFLDVQQYKGKLKGFDDIDEALISGLLSEGAKFCEEVLLPINQSGDAQGCQFDNGTVNLPEGFTDAYKLYSESGWTSFTCDAEYGGQGLPEVLNMPIIEMICSANLSFGILPGLTHGAYNAIYKHASDELKNIYLPNMVNGSWSGVMCLTESHCGTDLGLIRTKAVPADDGTYHVSGTKIFISAGEQDATENIIHLVLAKLPDAPAGPKGISLFIVPKFLVNADGTLGERNTVSCGSIEEKMGIHASPTCVMNYDNAVGYLVGEPHKGLRAMFTMMNEARLYVGVQGAGLAEIAYQNAAEYCKNRLQGRSLKGAKYPEKDADPLIVHPDVRRTLMTVRVFCEGARMLECYTALKLDISKHHEDAKERKDADDYVQLVTPILKAYFTDMGVECTNMALQLYGGHGYIREWGMEQYARDARIAPIYEGANGIQALDLVGRKLSKFTGRYLRSFFHPTQQFIEENRDDETMAEFTKPLYKAMKGLQDASMWVAINGLTDQEQAAGVSVEYLRMFALAIMADMWARAAKVALEKLAESEGDAFYEAKLHSARFFMKKILPAHYSLLASIVEGAKPMMVMDEEMF